MPEPPNYAQISYANGEIVEYTIKRTLVKDGLVMPGLPGFKPLGDGLVTCYYCNRPLTDELSRARGCGPECVVRHGPLAGREWVEDFAKKFANYQRKQEKMGLPTSDFNVFVGPIQKVLS
jgi:hypothetical protein